MVLHALTNVNLYFKSVNSLSSRTISYSVALRKRISRYPVLRTNEVIQHPKYKPSLDDELLNSLKDKLIFNSLVAARNNSVRWAVRRQIKDSQKKKSIPFPISLKYVDGAASLQEYENDKDLEDEFVEDEDSYDINFPYRVVEKVDIQEDTEVSDESTKLEKKFIPNTGMRNVFIISSHKSQKLTIKINFRCGAASNCREEMDERLRSLRRAIRNFR